MNENKNYNGSNSSEAAGHDMSLPVCLFEWWRPAPWTEDESDSVHVSEENTEAEQQVSTSRVCDPLRKSSIVLSLFQTRRVSHCEHQAEMSLCLDPGFGSHRVQKLSARCECRLTWHYSGINCQRTARCVYEAGQRPRWEGFLVQVSTWHHVQTGGAVKAARCV